MTSRLWNPFANMAEVAANKLCIERAEGVWVYSSDKRYLDATSSLWFCNVGHGRREIIDAIQEQLIELDAYNIFGDMTNRPAEMLADWLVDLSPFDDAKIFLNSGGGDAIDTAMKIARRFHAAQGREQRQIMLSRTNGYHGTNGIGTGLSGIPTNRQGFGDIVPSAHQVAWDSADDLESRIIELGPENISSFVFEPVMGAGGLLIPPEGYIERVVSICKKYDIVTIADSVICGFGRLGNWFGIERWAVKPDMIVFAKGVTSGYQPLGGVVVSAEISAPFWEGSGVHLNQGSTYSGFPPAATAALVNIEILEREGLMRRSGEIEHALSDALTPHESSQWVKEVRAGVGAMAAVELDDELIAHHPGAAKAVNLAARERGLLTRVLGNSLAVSPPLIIEQREIDFIGTALMDAIESVARNI